jgi:hypothetical protein
MEERSDKWIQVGVYSDIKIKDDLTGPPPSGL